MEDDEGEQSNVISSTFPRPPPFYEHFTPRNIARLKEIRAESTEGAQTSSAPLWQGDATGLADLPTELRFLIPPPLPASGSYRSFGETLDVHETLPELPENIEQLFPHSQGRDPHQEQRGDHARHLHKLAQSLLLNFLELVGMLAANADLASAKIDDLRTLFFNAHQLVNEYRPHQARETLIEMMEQRLEQKRGEVRDVKVLRERVDKLFAELGESRVDRRGGEQTDEATNETNKRAAKLREEQKRVWSALNAIET